MGTLVFKMSRERTIKLLLADATPTFCHNVIEIIFEYDEWNVHLNAIIKTPRTDYRYLLKPRHLKHRTAAHYFVLRVKHLSLWRTRAIEEKNLTDRSTFRTDPQRFSFLDQRCRQCRKYPNWNGCQDRDCSTPYDTPKVNCYSYWSGRCLRRPPRFH